MNEEGIIEYPPDTQNSITENCIVALILAIITLSISIGFIFLIRLLFN